MNSEILHLEPLLIWKNFNSLLQIPRSSGKEQKVVLFGGGWPGWEPNLESGILKVMQDVYQKKIESGIALSPLLLIRDAVHGKDVIADGYHRLCAIYSFDEDAVICCKIV